MSKLYDAFEAALQACAEGKSIDEALSLSPDFRAELLPILRAALSARDAADPSVPRDLKLRVRARFLQQVAEMREASVAKRGRIIPALLRAAITLCLVVLLVLSSSGLVRASSTAVPGDQLYRVKRSWEDIRLLLSAQPGVQYMLASEFEQERLDEIEELLVRGRAAPITFSGMVSLMADGSWLVSGIPVIIPSAATLPSSPIVAGQPVLVSGVTRSDGTVEASRIQLLLPGAALPPLGPSEHDDAHVLEAAPPNAAPEGPLLELEESGSLPTYAMYEFTGIVERMGIDTWQINRQQVAVGDAAIIGVIKVGSEIRFDGYYDPNGTFVATRVEASMNLNHDDGREDGGEGDAAVSEGSDAGGSGQESEHESESEGGDDSGEPQVND